MVSTHLKNISQIGSFPQVSVKIKNMKPPPRRWFPHRFGAHVSPSSQGFVFRVLALIFFDRNQATTTSAQCTSMVPGIGSNTPGIPSSKLSNIWSCLDVGFWRKFQGEISNGRTQWMDPEKTWVSHSSCTLPRGPLVRVLLDFWWKVRINGL